jgi:lipopolysaccharide transport system ATP-binding protein
MIVLTGVHKQFRTKGKKKEEPLKFWKKDKDESFWALSEINLQITPGERVGILGMNGSGKTTLLKLISGITEPSLGTVSVSGKVAPFFGANLSLDKNQTARENIYLIATSLGQSLEDIKSKLPEIVTISGVDKLDTPLKFLSNGMGTRIYLSLIFVLDFDILILDEAFFGLDVHFKEVIFRRLETLLLDKSKTLLLVSHSEEIVRNFCHRLVLFHDGKLQMDGSFDAVNTFYLEKNPSKMHL